MNISDHKHSGAEVIQYGAYGCAICLAKELAEVQQRLIAFLDSPEGRNVMAARQRDTANRCVDELEHEIAAAESKLNIAWDALKFAEENSDHRSQECELVIDDPECLRCVVGSAMVKLKNGIQ